MATIYRAKNRPNWMVAWFDSGGTRRVRSTGTTDRKAAERLASKLETDVMLAREGIVDPRAGRFATAGRTPLEEHVRDFLKHLADRERAAKHVSDREGQLTRLLQVGKMARIADLTPARAQGAIADLRTVRQISASTSNRYLRAIKSFSRWLVREGRAESDPLIGLTGFNVALDRRHERRALTWDEIGKLIAATESAREYRGLNGHDRAMLYRLALGTGFRAHEIGSLTHQSFDLDASLPTVTVRAAYSKRRREDRQPIRRDLADILRPWLADRPPGVRVFNVPHLHHRTAHMMRHDLGLAGIDYVDEDGRYADFHSLRVSYVTAVVRSGATVKEAQALARHADPSLTFKVYAKTSLDDLGRALDAMPATASDTSAGANNRRTGS